MTFEALSTAYLSLGVEESISIETEPEGAEDLTNSCPWTCWATTKRSALAWYRAFEGDGLSKRWMETYIAQRTSGNCKTYKTGANARYNPLRWADPKSSQIDSSVSTQDTSKVLTGRSPNTVLEWRNILSQFVDKTSDAANEIYLLGFDDEGVVTRSRFFFNFFVSS